MTHAVRSAAIATLAALAAVAAIIAADLTPPAQAQSDDVMLDSPGEEPNSGRIVARRLRDNRTEYKTEFGWQQRTNLGWGDRVLPLNRFFPADPGHSRWLPSSPVEVEGVELGLIEVRLLADDRLEFAFLRTTGERILPQSRYFPADAPVDRFRWLHSAEITIENSDSEDLHQQIAERFAPVLHFEQDEDYFPVPVELMIRHSTLHYTRNGQERTRAPRTYGLTHLISHIGEESYLDLADWRRGEKGDRVVYARVAETYGEGQRGVLVQYWFFYLYNATGEPIWSHEGDWEGIQLWFAGLSPDDLLTATVPAQTGYAAHESGWAYRLSESCAELSRQHPTFALWPSVYVARNRHASYIVAGSGGDRDKSFDGQDQFQGNGAAWALQGRDIPDVEGELGYEIRLLPEYIGRSGYSWLGWNGRWGDTGGDPRNDGPLGPAFKSHFRELPVRNGWSEGTYQCHSRYG